MFGGALLKHFPLQRRPLALLYPLYLLFYFFLVLLGIFLFVLLLLQQGPLAPSPARRIYFFYQRS